MPAGLDLGGSGFSAANIIGGLLFSGIGFVAFSYGKKQGNTNAMIWGGALMAYCYFTPTALWTWLVGLVLTAAFYFSRD